MRGAAVLDVQPWSVAAAVLMAAVGMPTLAGNMHRPAEVRGGAGQQTDVLRFVPEIRFQDLQAVEGREMLGEQPPLVVRVVARPNADRAEAEALELSELL